MFDQNFRKDIWVACSSAQMLYDFLRDHVGVLGMGCVARAWTRGRIKARGKSEALAFLKELDDTFLVASEGSTEGLVEDWNWEMKRLSKVVEKW